MSSLIYPKLIHELVEPFNASQQAYSRYMICINQPNHIYIQSVTTNTISNWEKYFMDDLHRLYSKGSVRLDNLYTICAHLINTQYSLNESWFIIAGSIILLQVYGDGNHRTANFLYTKYTRQVINFEIVHQIQVLESDIVNPISNTACVKYINALLNIYRTVIN